jgi:hypothetical protein
VLPPLQADLLRAAILGDAGKVQACLAAGVSANCKDRVGAPLLPTPARTLGVPACSNLRGGCGGTWEELAHIM